MKKIRSSTLHYGFRTLVLLGFAVYIVYLFKTDSLVYYIAPRMMIYAKIAAVGLYIIAVLQAYVALRSLREPVSAGCSCGHDAHDHDHDHAHGHDHEGHSHAPTGSFGKHAAAYAVFVIPLLLGFLLPTTAMSSALVAQKGINLGGPPAAVNDAGGTSSAGDWAGDEDPQLKERFKTDKYNRDFAKLGIKLYKQDTLELKDELFMEKLQALNMFPDNFAGKPIKMLGFVYRDTGMSDTQFIVGRFAVTCCTADASTYGVVVQSSNANRFADDTWVTVSGTIGEMTYKGKKVITIQAASIEKTKPPENPYVYPVYDFGSRL
ncbi:TIGR03943 family protein [Paenibacillus athensensis]|uniref:TIGR03943 family putative permease subunit n=1 Tax=Paenibacillus athensensis TaxID=1967502 RepID=UPI001430B977|nr:TIGR03943 family protein [Paenibacillus athensensis]MCD1260446.1 TIGR03943 family protein [Paenibacillus athensensis]